MGSERWKAEAEANAKRFESEGMGVVADDYATGPARIQFQRKDPMGWQEFRDDLAGHSSTGAANTFRGVQITRPSIFDLKERMNKLTVPTLIFIGDEDEPCVDAAVFMKRNIPTAGLSVLPQSGHTINLEEPDLYNRIVLDFLIAVEAGRWPAHEFPVEGASQLTR